MLDPPGPDDSLLCWPDRAWLRLAPAEMDDPADRRLVEAPVRHALAVIGVRQPGAEGAHQGCVVEGAGAVDAAAEEHDPEQAPWAAGMRRELDPDRQGRLVVTEGQLREDHAAGRVHLARRT